MAGTYTNLLAHIIFSTKHRTPLINSKLREDLHRYLGGIIRSEGGTSLEIGGMPDHVHLLVKLKPNRAVSDMLRLIKANSSKWVNAEKNQPRRFGWQDGYAAFSVSESQVPNVRRYIRNQEEHHKKVDFKTELLELFRKHRVEFDERYLWD